MVYWTDFEKSESVSVFNSLVLVTSRQNLVRLIIFQLWSRLEEIQLNRFEGISSTQWFNQTICWRNIPAKPTNPCGISVALLAADHATATEAEKLYHHLRTAQYYFWKRYKLLKTLPFRQYLAFELHRLLYHPSSRIHDYQIPRAARLSILTLTLTSSTLQSSWSLCGVLDFFWVLVIILMAGSWWGSDEVMAGYCSATVSFKSMTSLILLRFDLILSKVPFDTVSFLANFSQNRP